MGEGVNMETTVADKRLIEAAEEFMNMIVRERGYYNILTAVSYAGDEDVIYDAEGKAAKKWRSRVYHTVYQIIKDVHEGKRDMPTNAQLVLELPDINWNV